MHRFGLDLDGDLVREPPVRVRRLEVDDLRLVAGRAVLLARQVPGPEEPSDEGIAPPGGELVHLRREQDEDPLEIPDHELLRAVQQTLLRHKILP